MIRSNSVLFRRASPSSALVAPATSNPSFLRKISNSSRIDRSSSTTKIFARLGILDIDEKGGACAFARFDSNRSVMGHDDLVDHGKAEPSPLLERRIEGQKHPLQLLFSKPNPSILKPNFGDAVSSLQTDGQRSAIGHRLERVGGEIVKHLTHHASV